MSTNYSRSRYYQKSSVTSNGERLQQIIELQKQLAELIKERDRLRGSLALYEAENARLHKWYEGACLEIQRITGGV